MFVHAALDPFPWSAVRSAFAACGPTLRVPPVAARQRLELQVVEMADGIGAGPVIVRSAIFLNLERLDRGRRIRSHCIPTGSTMIEWVLIVVIVCSVIQSVFGMGRLVFGTLFGTERQFRDDHQIARSRPIVPRWG